MRGLSLLDCRTEKLLKTKYQPPPAASRSSKSEKDLLLFLLSVWHFGFLSVVRSKEKIARFVWQISKRGGVGSERKNSLPRRLPKSCCPDYRSERKFEKIPVQRVAKPLCGVILAKGKKAAHSGPQVLFCPFYVRKNQTGAVCGSYRASFYHGAKIRNSAVLPLAGNLLGSAFPKPCYGGLHRKNISVRQAAFLREPPRKYLTDQPIFCDK